MTTIWKNGEEIASPYENLPMVELTLPSSPTRALAGEVQCYYFPRLRLTPPTIWKVMAGTGLISFFDRCGVEDGERRIDNLRYAHGRMEKMKGNPTVSTVLLVSPRDPLPNEVWLTYLPSIYADFLRMYDGRTKGLDSTDSVCPK